MKSAEMAVVLRCLSSSSLRLRNISTSGADSDSIGKAVVILSARFGEIRISLKGRTGNKPEVAFNHPKLGFVLYNADMLEEVLRNAAASVSDPNEGG